MRRPRGPAGVPTGVAMAVSVILAWGCSSGGTAASPTDGSALGPTEPVAVDAGSRQTAPLPTRSPEGLASDEAVLTGLPAADVDLLARPALAVKIDNVTAARPQTGIVEADLVYEELVEGGLTRLLAVFHSEDPPVVGPVRSARSTDVPLLMPLVEPLFAWSGANASFAELLGISAVIDVGVDHRPEAYVRRAGRGAPSNLYADPVLLRSHTPEGSLPPEAHFTFAEPGATTAPGAVPVLGVDVSWGTTEVSFRWDPSADGWARTQDGTPHLDEAGRQVAPVNVVVQFVPYLDTDAVDGNGAPVPEAQIMSGAGSAWVLSGGAVLEGTWTKANATVPTAFSGSDGAPVPFTRGPTWVLLVPDGRASLVRS